MTERLQAGEICYLPQVESANWRSAELQLEVRFRDDPLNAVVKCSLTTIGGRQTSPLFTFTSIQLGFAFGRELQKRAHLATQLACVCVFSRDEKVNNCCLFGVADGIAKLQHNL